MTASDADLTFGIADPVPVADVLNDWTRTLIEELDGVRLADPERGATIYRVFLLPGALQFDLSMTPAAQFRPAGPRFRLLFGQTAAAGSLDLAPRVAGDLFIPTPTRPWDLFAWGVIYALHARASIERGRVWQAEHYVGAVRDHALSIACLREGLPAVQARGYDDLSPETLSQLDAVHVGAVERGALRAALAASTRALSVRPRRPVLRTPTGSRAREKGTAAIANRREPVVASRMILVLDQKLGPTRERLQCDHLLVLTVNPPDPSTLTALTFHR